MDKIISFGKTLLEFILHSFESLDLLVTGWADLPGEIGVFLHALGPAGDVLSVVLYLCVGYLVLRLLIIVIELIPGF